MPNPIDTQPTLAESPEGAELLELGDRVKREVPAYPTIAAAIIRTTLS